MELQSQLNVLHFPKELQVMLKCIQLPKEEIPVYLKSAELNQFNWQEFLNFSMHHRLYPILHKQLNELSEFWIPSFVLNSIQNHYEFNTFNMLHLSGEMEDVCRLFSEHDIQTLVLKGPVLAKAVYGELSSRTSADLDLLLPLQDVKKAEKLLEQTGYVKDEMAEPLLNERKWREHHVVFFHPIKNIKLEIHWKLNPNQAKEPTFEELWAGKQKTPLTKFPVFLLGKEELMMFLISHGARHGWFRLRWLLDVDQLMRQKLNWKKVFYLLEKYHLNSAAGQAILLSVELFSTPVPEVLQPLMKAEKAKFLARFAMFFLKEKRALTDKSLPLFESIYYKTYLCTLRSLQENICAAGAIFYPSRKDAQLLPLPVFFHFAYFPLRPVLWGCRKIQKIPVWKKIVR